MDAPARLARGGGLEAYVSSSRARGDEPGEDARALRVARAASRGSYHVAARAKRLVGAVFSFWFLVSSFWFPVSSFQLFVAYSRPLTLETGNWKRFYVMPSFQSK